MLFWTSQTQFQSSLVFIYSAFGVKKSPNRFERSLKYTLKHKMVLYIAHIFFRLLYILLDDLSCSGGCLGSGIPIQQSVTGTFNISYITVTHSL